LWDVIRAYQPDPVTAVVAFLLFTIAAISMVATYLFALYGAVGASGYMIVRQCALRLDNGEQGGHRGPAGHINNDDDFRGGGGSSGSAREEHASWRDSGIRMGQRVRVVGLASRPEFNGLGGVVCGQVRLSLRPMGSMPRMVDRKYVSGSFVRGFLCLRSCRAVSALMPSLL
jgi:hypothetical protein